MQWNRIQYCCLDGKLSLISYAFVLGYFEKRNQPELLMVTDVCQRGHFEAETQWMGCPRILRLTTARKRWLEESDCTAGDCSNRRHWLRVCKPSCQWHIGSSDHTHANLKSHVVCNHDTQSHGSTMLMRISVWRYPKSERNRIRNFFRYKIFPIPNPILFSIPNFFDTESDIFFDTKFFPIQNPILFSIPIFFRYRIRYFFPC